MKIMSEKELRGIPPEEFEGKDISWDNETDQDNPGQIGKLLFDYDQGFSLTDKDDSEDCLVGTHGPSYKSKNKKTGSNYTIGKSA